jgi:hypothetical protein
MSVSLARNPIFAQRLYYEATTASQTIATSTTTIADLPASATYDNGLALAGTAMHDGTNNRCYLRRAGIWHVFVSTSWAVNGTGLRRVDIVLNGTTTIAANVNNNYGGFFGTFHSTETLYYASGTGDYVDCRVNQSSGGNLATTSILKATWLGPIA